MYQDQELVSDTTPAERKERIRKGLDTIKEMVEEAFTNKQSVSFDLTLGNYSKPGPDGWALNIRDGSAVLLVIIGPLPPDLHEENQCK